MCDVIDDSVHLPLEGIGNLGANFRKYFVGNGRVSCTHPIQACYCSDDDGLSVDPDILVDADAPDREQCSEVLPRQVASPQ